MLPFQSCSLFTVVGALWALFLTTRKRSFRVPILQFRGDGAEMEYPHPSSPHQFVVTPPPPWPLFETYVNSVDSVDWIRNPVKGGVVVIPPYDHILYNRRRKRLFQRIDDDPNQHPYDPEEEDDDAGTTVCRKPSWAKHVHSNCHAFHEIHLPRDTQWISHGTYRDAWTCANEESLLKTMILTDPKLNYDTKRFAQIATDATVMEALTASNRITDIYGYCGTSVLTELLEDTVVSDLLGGAAAAQQQQRPSLDASVCQNQLSLPQKLDMAIQFTESLAELHGFLGGVMMHGDFHSPQWLRSGSDIKLNDFNKGHIFRWNGTDYCPTERCYKGSYRAPEEIRCERNGNEASDTHAVGNNLYVLLTGRWPHYEFFGNRRKELMNQIAYHERIPYVHPSFSNRSLVEDTLIELMHACWERDIHQRILVFQVLEQLYRVRSVGSSAFVSSHDES